MTSRDYRRDLAALLLRIPDAAKVGPTCTPVPDGGVLHAAFLTARREYERFIVLEHERLKKVVGFSFDAVEDAPSSYEEVCSEFNRSYTTGRSPFRVWSGASDDTVFTSAGMNHMFRFVHDVGHVLEGCDFSAEGEQRLITAMVWRVFDKAGFLAALLAACDLLAQHYYNQHNHGAYVEKQEPYVRSVFYMLLSTHHQIQLAT